MAWRYLCCRLLLCCLVRYHFSVSILDKVGQHWHVLSSEEKIKHGQHTMVPPPHSQNTCLYTESIETHIFTHVNVFSNSFVWICLNLFVYIRMCVCALMKELWAPKRGCNCITSVLPGPRLVTPSHLWAMEISHRRTWWNAQLAAPLGKVEVLRKKHVNVFWTKRENLMHAHA